MINDLTIVGNVGSDAEIKQTQAGKKIVSFSIAFSKKDKDGNDKSTWIRATVFEGQTAFWANEAAKVKKGDRLLLKGPIELRSFINKEGVEKQSLEMIANSLIFIAKGEKPFGISPPPSVQQSTPFGFDLPGIPF